MVAYADTSFLLAIYVVQKDSPRALSYLQRTTAPLPFTPFHRLELRNAIRLCVFRKEITSDHSRRALRDVENDLAEGILTHVSLPWTDALQKAEELGADHSEVIGNRSFDILQVACALQIRATVFLTFDTRQRELAERSGLKVRF
jgi:predicted nucleic acid-binding protein